MVKPISKRRRFTAITAALMVISSCSSDAPKSALQPSEAQSNQRFSFELWEEPLVGGLGSHAAIIVRDRNQPDDVLILQGLATDRKTLDVRPVGDPARDNIYAYIDEDSAQGMLNDRIFKVATVYQTNSGIDMATRLTAMLKTAKFINTKDYAYQLLSSSKLAGKEAYNSNATAFTLLNVAGFDLSAVRFSGYAPGWGQTITTQTIDAPTIQIKSFQEQEQAEDSLSRLAGSLSQTIYRHKNKSADKFYIDPSVAIFLEKVDMHGEKQRRKKVVSAYKALPFCRTESFRDYVTTNVVYGDAGMPLTKDDVIDNFSVSAFHGYVSRYNVLLDPESKKLCQSNEYNHLPTRSEAKAYKRIKPEANKPA